MSQSVSTSGSIIATERFDLKRGERFTVAVQIQPEDGITFTGMTGTAQLRKSDGTLMQDFGTVTATIDGDGVATMVFDATTTQTDDWYAGTYWWDARWSIGSTYGPKCTPTYKVTVYEGPTQP